MMKRSLGVGALKVLAACVACMSLSASAHALQLMAYDMEGTVTTDFGPGVADVSGLGTALNATLVGGATGGAVVVDATRPGGGAGNQVLYTGTNASLVGAATADNHPGLSKLNTTGSMTLAAWLRGTTTGGFRQVFGRGHQGERLFNFANSVNEDIGFAISNTNVGGFQFNVANTTPDVNDGNWHHFAMSYDAPAKTVTLFFDGAVALVHNLPAGATNRVSIGSGAGVGIGMRYDGQNQLLDHYIDDAVMWDEAADPAKIALIASGAVSGTDIGFIGVPEPASAVVLATAVAALAVRRRRG